jgi:putative transposase
MSYRSTTTNCRVRLLPLRGLNRDQAELCHFLRIEAGRCWTDMVEAHLASRDGKWLSEAELKSFSKGHYGLHSQSIQALAEKLVVNVDSARELRKTNPNARYPYRPKFYQTVSWKESAIHRTEQGGLSLSNGKSRPALILRIPQQYLDGDLCRVELTWRADHYELCLTIDTRRENAPLKESGQVAGVDLGEVNIAAVCTETGDSLVVNGRALCSVKHLRNKRQAAYASLLSHCKKGSKRYCRLMKSKSRASAKLFRQQRDILHKASRQVITFCQDNEVRAIAVGDVRDVQDGVNLGKNNQKISQWPHGQFMGYLRYKAREVGLSLDQIPEDYSTRTCSHSGHVRSYAPRGRVFVCSGCGAMIHRDVNGAANICSRAVFGLYACIQAHTTTYLRPLRRSIAFDTGQRCLP